MKIEGNIKIDEFFEVSVKLNNVEPNIDMEGFMDALKESVMMNWYNRV